MELNDNKKVRLTNDALKSTNTGELRCVEFKKEYVIYKTLWNIKDINVLMKKLKEIKNGGGKTFSLSGNGQSGRLKIFRTQMLDGTLIDWMKGLAEKTKENEDNKSKIQTEEDFMGRLTNFKINIQITHKDLIERGSDLIKAYKLVNAK